MDQTAARVNLEQLAVLVPIAVPITVPITVTIAIPIAIPIAVPIAIAIPIAVPIAIAIQLGGQIIYNLEIFQIVCFEEILCRSSPGSQGGFCVQIGGVGHGPSCTNTEQGGYRA
jgi:hypothetical protein